MCTPRKINNKLTFSRIPTECVFQNILYSGFQAGRLQDIQTVNLRHQFTDEIDRGPYVEDASR